MRSPWNLSITQTYLDKFPWAWFLVAIRARTFHSVRLCAIERAFIRSQSGNYRRLSIFFDVSDRCLLLVSYPVSACAPIFHPKVFTGIRAQLPTAQEEPAHLQNSITVVAATAMRYRYDKCGS